MAITITIICMSIIFCFRRRMGQLIYQMLISTTYLVALSFIKTLDVTLVIYMLFAIFPFLKFFKIRRNASLIFILYFGIDLMFSTLLYGISNSFSIFIIRYIGLVYFWYFFSNVDYEALDCNICRNNKLFLDQKRTLLAIRLFAVCEFMILVVALLIVEFNSRLMINYQCTVGNLSVAGILLCGYNFCLSKKDIVVKDFFYSLYFASIAIISGTRGYLVICMGMMVLYCFLFGNRVIRIFCICFFLVLFMLNVENFMELFFQLTRLKESTGRRKSEDLFVWNYMIEHPKYMFFGVGFGRTVGSLKGITNIINKVSNTAYTNYILYKVKGFHNFFTTIYYSSGIVGLTISAAMIVKTFKKVNRVIWDRKFRLICLVYLALYVSMLWFRWSATSGIIEFFTLSYLMYSSSMRYKIKAEL